MRVGKIIGMALSLVGIVIAAVGHLWMIFDPNFNINGAYATAIFGYSVLTIGIVLYIVLTIITLFKKRQIQDEIAEEELVEIVQRDPKLQ